ncbi:flavin reductase family protein [Actinomadura kijaniata]|uniref:NADPH-dependent flavin reductase n=1 Tax=Actinomadura kijaniata TaxID=46161 RepID=B3TMR4_ACTKI|nr:flavin reductase family protein [Actinomadura kijaniata]ACB46494.1 NADPH-dependent flavin reductase [Actinomadura kijaniata]
MATRRAEPPHGLLDPDRDAPDPGGLRRVLGHFATGVALVTGLDAGKPVGLLVNSFTSVSLEPPLIAFCVAHTSSSWPRLRAGGRHCVSFLAADQREQAHRLAASGDAKFRGLAWSPSPSGLPLPDGALAWLECAVEAEHPAGDHVIVVARVHRMGRSGAVPHPGPLVFYRGGYGRFTTE